MKVLPCSESASGSVKLLSVLFYPFVSILTCSASRQPFGVVKTHSKAQP
jgi:hypothetical protein